MARVSTEQVWVSRSTFRVQIVFDMWAGPVYGWEDGGVQVFHRNAGATPEEYATNESFWG